MVVKEKKVNRFEVSREFADGRCFVKGEFRDLYPDTNIIVYKGDREWNAVVETRTGGGAVARVVMER